MSTVISGYLIDNIKITKIQDHTAAGTSTVTSDEIDMAGYDGVVFVTSFGTAASGNLITMHHGAVSGTVAASVALLASGTSDEDVILDVQRPIFRYLKCVATRGTSSTLESMWAIQYKARAEPVTNAVSGTLVTATFNAPASA